nr:MAG TPA: hypothetical protein [Caudoviricetes sp.]
MPGSRNLRDGTSLSDIKSSAVIRAPINDLQLLME